MQMFSGMDGGEPLRFELVTATAPVAIDFYKKFGDKEKGPIRGILLVQGETLKICFGRLVSDARPKDFASPRKSSITLITLKRGKQ